MKCVFSLFFTVFFIFSIHPVFGQVENEEILLANEMELEAIKMNLPEPARIFFKYILSAVNLEGENKTPQQKVEIFDRGILSLIKYFKSPREVVPVNSLEEFAEYMRGHSPRFLDSQKEIAFFDKSVNIPRYVLKVENPELKREIQNHLDIQIENLIDFLTHRASPNSANLLNNKMYKEVEILARNDLASVFLDAQTHNDSDRRQDEIAKILNYAQNQISEKDKIKLIEQLEYRIVDIEKKIRSVGEVVSNTKFDMAESQGPKIQGAKRFFQLLLSNYFKYENSDGIRNMISGGIDNISAFIGNTDPIIMFEVALQYAKPNLNKLLQIVARQSDVVKGKIQSVLKRLEDKLLPASWPEIKEIYFSQTRKPTVIEIEEEISRGTKREIAENMRVGELKNKNGTIFYLEIKKVSFKAGSIAQMHTAKIRLVSPNSHSELQEAAVRFIIPGKEEDTRKGAAIFEKIAEVVDKDPLIEKLNMPKLGPVVKNLEANILNDTDSIESAKRQVEGEKEYKFDKEFEFNTAEGRKIKVVLEFRAPHIYDYNKDFMTMELVSGKKLDHVQENYPELAKGIVTNMTNQWLSKGLFLKGFFHADLHLGNFLIELKDLVRVLQNINNQNESEIAKIRINILDYGMGGTLSPGFRAVFFGMIIASQLKDMKMLSDLLWEVRDSKATSELGIIKSKMHLEEILREKINSDSSTKPGNLPAYAMEMGLRLPEEIVGIGRGMSTIQLINRMVGLKSKIEQILLKLFQMEPKRIYDLFSNILLKEEVRGKLPSMTYQALKKLTKYLKNQTIYTINGGKCRYMIRHGNALSF